MKLISNFIFSFSVFSLKVKQIRAIIVLKLYLRLPPQMARSSIHTEEVAGADKEKKLISGEEQERKIMGYEEAMHKIKEATGVSDIQVH